MAFSFKLAQPSAAPKTADQTADYNTPLTPGEEAAFQVFLQRSGRAADLANYDLRGAWRSNAKAANNGHLPDDWKKPGHPTFSVESIYSGPYGSGGAWEQIAPPTKTAPQGRWRFIASPDNLRHQSAEDLRAYFGRVEPGNELVLPPVK